MTVTNVNTLSNKELKKGLVAILKELSKVNKSAWTIAQKYREIVDGEQYNSDFESFAEFANYVGVKRATLILYTKVARLSNVLKAEPYNFDIETDVTVSKVIELLPLFNDIDIFDTELIYGMWCGTIDEMGGFEVFKSLTNKEVREWVKDYLTTEESEEAEEAETEAEAEEAEESEEAEEAEAEAEAEETEVVIPNYVLTKDNFKDFEKTILNLIEQGTTSFHVTVRK